MVRPQPPVDAPRSGRDPVAARAMRWLAGHGMVGAVGRRGRFAAGLLLGLSSCETAEAPGGQRPAPLLQKLDATDERLTALETRLDAITTRLDHATGSMHAITDLAAQHKAAEDAKEAERLAKRQERDQARHRLRQRLGLDGVPPPPPPRPTPATTSAALPAPSPRPRSLRAGFPALGRVLLARRG